MLLQIVSFFVVTQEHREHDVNTCLPPDFISFDSSREPFKRNVDGDHYNWFEVVWCDVIWFGEMKCDVQ